LSTLRTWGTPVLVHNAIGSKLEARARNARWLGPDADTKVHRVYWPGMGNVTVERNIYFGTSAQLKGEEENLPASDSEQAAAPRSPTNSPPNDPPFTPTVEDADADDETELQEEQPAKLPPPPPRRSERLRRPSRLIRDLQSREGITLAHHDSPKVSMGLQIPDPLAEESEEAGGVWVVIDGAPEILEDFEGLEYTFMAETADAN